MVQEDWLIFGVGNVFFTVLISLPYRTEIPAHYLSGAEAVRRYFQLIDSIVYYSRFADHVYATKEYLTLSDGVPYKKENPIL